MRNKPTTQKISRSIRVFVEDYDIIAKIAKSESRSIIITLSRAIKNYAKSKRVK